MWTQDTELKRATSKLQKEIDAVKIWSTSWKIELSVEKSDCSFFATNTHEARWRLALCLNRQQILCNPNPKFLGISYHRLQEDAAIWSDEVHGVNRLGP